MNLEGVNCFKCEAEGKEAKADLVVVYLGIETPVCRHCYEKQLRYDKVELVK